MGVSRRRDLARRLVRRLASRAGERWAAVVVVKWRRDKACEFIYLFYFGERKVKRGTRLG
jgi:hypothetical protein